MATLRKARRHVWYGQTLDNDGLLGLAAFACVIVTLIVLVCFGDSYHTNVDEHNTASDVRIEMVKKFDKMDSEERQSTARSILRLNKRGFDTPLNNAGEDKSRQAEVREQLKQVAKTGEALTLDDSKKNWNHFWGWIFVLIIGGALSVYMAICFLIYAFQSGRREEFLMDLPWRRVWPYLYVLATIWPLGWLFYPVSAVRTYRANKRYVEEEPHQEQRRRRPEFDIDVDADYDDYERGYHRDDTPPRQKSVKFNHEPNAARRLYFDLRNGGWRTYLTNKVDELKDEKEDVEERLDGIASEARNLQRQRGEIMAELQELQGTEIPEEPIDATALEAEFNRLLKLPGVQAVRVVNDKLSLYVKARLNYEGVVYDLGDWDLRIGGDTNFAAKELRSGVRRHWHGYPAYRLDDETFCFGSRESVIAENLRKGQLLEAAELAVNSLNNVNDEDLYRVPNAFYEEKQEEVA